MIASFRRPRWSLLTRVVLAACLQPAIFALLLFGAAGTWAWWRAWVLLATVAVVTVASVVALARGDQGLLEERMKPLFQPDQPRADKIVVMIFLAGFLGTIAFVPVDVFDLHLLPPPGPWVSSAGLLAFLAGWAAMTWALRANAFAAPVVKHQEARHHRVIDTGPYAVVRHPMYVGAALLLIGLPLWLRSTAGALAASIPILTLAVRIGIEERFLRRELAGYDAYTTRVRYRLIPGVW